MDRQSDVKNMMKTHDLMKRLSIVFVILLFAGVTISVSATNGDSLSSKDSDATVTKFIMASINSSDADLLDFDGRILPGFNSKGSYVAIGINLWFEVKSGEVKVKPLIGKEITLKPGDSFSMKFGILYMNQDSDPNERDIQFARAYLGYTIQYLK